MDAAGGAVAKRLVPVLAGVTLLAILIWLFRRKKSWTRFAASTSGQAARVIILVTLVLFVVVFVVVTLHRRATTRWRQSVASRRRAGRAVVHEGVGAEGSAPALDSGSKRSGHGSTLCRCGRACRDVPGGRRTRGAVRERAVRQRGQRAAPTS